jgi:hypothetical protein
LHAQNITVSAFTKNILLWSGAKMNVDPESAYTQNGPVLKQGLSNWSGSPVIMQAGFKISTSF